MRKNMGNDKVLRAITIGLATMIAASSSPVTVFAEEGDGESAPAPATETSSEASSESSGGEGGEQTSQETSENSSSSEADNSEVYEEAKEVSDTVSNDVEPVVEAVEQAVEEVAPMPQILDEAGAAAITEDLNAAAAYIDDKASEADALGSMVAAQENINNAIMDAHEADGIVDAGNAALFAQDEDGKTFADRIDDFATAEESATGHANEVINQADIANNQAQTKDQAVEAKERAKDELDQAEEGLFVAVNEYNAAQEAVYSAQSELEEAIAKQKEAQAKLDAAKQDLNKAGMDATAANEKMKAAQAKLQRVKKEEEKAQQNANMMQAIERQTYATMVQYFRDTLKNDVVYKENGTLDIDACAKKITQAQIDAKAKNPGDVMMLGRDLLQKILDYKLSNDPNVDWDTLEIGKQEKGANGKVLTEHRDAREGIVFESGNLVNPKDKESAGQDQVVINKDRSSRGRNDKDLKANADTGVEWYKSTNNEDSGRSNRIKVTYKDKAGNEHTEYYNYIFKSSAFGDETDVGESPVYVALVNETSDGWVASEDPDVDIDDYSTLKQKLADANNTIKEYNEAVDAVNKAQQQVQELENRIKTLSEIAEKTGLDSSRIDKLEKDLEEANKKLDEATDKKEALEDKVEEARKAYDGIDLSRFDVKAGGASENVISDTQGEEADEESDGETADAGSSEGAGFTLPDSVIPPVSGGRSAAPIITPSVPASIAETAGGASTGGSEADGSGAGGAGAVLDGGTEASGTEDAGVLGARVEEENVNPETFGTYETEIDSVVNTDKADEALKLVRLGESEIPLAEMPDLMDDEGASPNWWWLFVIALLGATGKKMYEDHKKRKEAKLNADK